jgi:peptidoglycan/LPS O-acetylase OafA/YrhL
MDGIRGIAALWVLLFHIQKITGLSELPLLSFGELAVDLFIMMSGVLMTHHYLLRRDIEPWESPRSWFLFWVRRFFRIAPLYYTLLCIAFLFGPTLGEYRAVIAHQWPQAATDPSRYTNHGIENILAHISFVFGAIPAFHFKTPLPDWSIGLEMQFYAAFPFVMIVMARFGALRTALVIASVCLLMRWAFNGFWRFEMPSFLPIKMYMFLCGMLIASGRARGKLLPSLLFSLAVTLIYYALQPKLDSLSRVILVVVMYYLFNDGSLWSPPLLNRGLDRIRAALGGVYGKFFGDASYGVYLVHLLVLIPVMGCFVAIPSYVAASGVVRFSLCALVVIPSVYAIAFVLNHAIEKPGIKLGKIVSGKIR